MITMADCNVWHVWLAIALSAGVLGAQDDSVIFNERIHPLYFAPLDYPQVARLRNDQGAVVVRATLDADGNVKSVSALSGPKTLIPDTILNAKKWRFKPSSAREVVIVYIFQVQGLCALPCSSQFTFRPPNVAFITRGEPVIDH
jgi:TonB family protein